ncbi:hypothetical protein ASPBRDRAFT_474849 [Aspergillus brasiliensis CBS 101740]|uniref:Uncharacterized protein n=1 Tax=Aspergillus brasiliensis (strain CBS 101740 / IMI 381727 / IBT 21946) TaxID=767769 RepID=A0A1L9UTU9_ASPBC|nr:hypothetical protein ASPBRDRAFT_474849 [Aspergillus brasiliensis CBS 101740]
MDQAASRKSGDAQRATGAFRLCQSESAEDLRLGPPEVQRPARPTHGRSIHGRLVLALLFLLLVACCLSYCYCCCYCCCCCYGLSITTRFPTVRTPFCPQLFYSGFIDF